ncbi:hypothetical protein DFA_01883 [Cavenderia fasciculata]|uniref:Uncharacterized protein n=1 Tax=Cavenderia fasciculata TaxID=261658 RepID=F4PV87_CACFS|nr:uncharacterized protein DFA_01883 [Cavenderia fasciculata]EGG21995.1 hypothetical protein DFA_01883 [Cavenderia fasciculata]|eukprot:XP_004359846.1 hypothetical protein DFA_01883 [Cavenderia fasciculata]
MMKEYRKERLQDQQRPQTQRLEQRHREQDLQYCVRHQDLEKETTAHDQEQEQRNIRRQEYFRVIYGDQSTNKSISKEEKMVVRQRLKLQFKRQLQQQQQEKQRQRQPIDQQVFKTVWNNTFLIRLIYSKTIPISSDTLVEFKNHFTGTLQQYKKDPNLFVDKYGPFEFYECPVITAKLFAHHYQHVHKQRMMDYDRWLSVLDLVSGNPRNMVDTWLFRKAYEYLNRTDAQEVSDNNYRFEKTWENVIRSNNVELYNYTKTILPIPNMLKLIVIAIEPPRQWYNYLCPPGTKLLKALLKDLESVDPQDTWWLIKAYPIENWWLNIYKSLIEIGSITILQTIHKYISDGIFDFNSTFKKSLMILAIQSKQIESIQFLYNVCKIPISEKEFMIEAARTNDLSFLIKLNNIDTKAGHLYILFLHVMSSTYSHGFKQEFYRLGKQLNYIDKNLQQLIDTKQPFKYQIKNTQYFKLFQQYNSDDDSSSIPRLSFSSFNDV